MGIVTEATSPAGRVYRSLGFEPDTGTPRRTTAPAPSRTRAGAPS